MKSKVFLLSLLFCFLFSSYAFPASLPSTTSLTSLALSNIYSSSSGSYLVLRATGIGDVMATLTTGLRYSFDFGTVYIGAGSVPGYVIDFSQEDWSSNIVWQAELNLNLSKVGDWLDKQIKQLQKNISNTSNSDNN